jgi:AcrR family transcriptional regulator
MPKDRKSTQRERLLAGMIAAGNQAGHAGASVAAVIAHAGVSRPTFYDYFADRDQCFLAAIADAQQRLLSRVRAAVPEDTPERALQSAIRALLGFAVAEPAHARFLTGEALAGPPTARDARDRGLVEVERAIERAQRHAHANAEVPDISARTLLGGVHRLLAARLRRGEPDLSRLLQDLLDWVDSYVRPVGEHRWRTLTPGAAPALSPSVSTAPLAPPARLGPGRPRISEQRVAENQRLRILFAAAQLAEEKGYAASTTGEIMRLASVDARSFYGLFANKQDAFMAVYELGAQQTLALTAEAFFTGASWPERLWEAGRAFTQFLELNPLIAHVGFVEAYAVGVGAVQRVEDSHVAFTVFLQEGHQFAPHSRPSRVALEAMVTTVFEIVYRQAHRQPKPAISPLLAHMAALCLTPFIGAVEAERVIDRQT